MGAPVSFQSLPEAPPKRAALHPAQMAWEGMGSPGLRQSGSEGRPRRCRLRDSRLSSWWERLAASRWVGCGVCGWGLVRCAWAVGPCWTATWVGGPAGAAATAVAVSSCGAGECCWPLGCSALRVRPLPPRLPRLRLLDRGSSSVGPCWAPGSPPKTADEIVSKGKPLKSGRTPRERKRPVLQ